LISLKIEEITESSIIINSSVSKSIILRVSFFD
jgi:hypothetical protein